MNSKNFIILIIGLIISPIFGQENSVWLKGRVQNPNNDVSDVLIINRTTEKSTITDSFGQFSIEVELGDLLQFSAVQYVTQELIVTDSILNKKGVLVNLLENVIELEEVNIRPYGLTGKIALDLKKLDKQPVVNSQSLKLPNANIELLSQNERILKEADRGKFATGGIHLDTLFLFPIVGVYMNINLHKTLNFISGRTQKLKDAVKRDYNQKKENEITKKFSRSTISEGLDISHSNLDGFFTFCLAQNDFFEVLEAKNSNQIWEYLKVKSYKFKKENSLK
ncbi:hypothetical protein SAMN03080594_102268 [Arenibacter palladensis]|uniref:CarboxypepD_reg-like domain-containing protein n=1 Tax=Arenibacter palladensis TaxID=237373 RepID=A0A1M4Y0K0_9FLAO|nr:hypothetical protein [Arenibacter palladensis]SHE99218.1 hypothetical protein SAMN03080594_102268 [Arenibacter palladensis]